jgi:hypothetical protein
MGITNFKGYLDISEPTLTEAVEDNLVEYINWCFLTMEAFYNITIPSSGAYGGDRHRLVAVNDPRYTSGQVWEAYRQNWVWESGLSVSEQPVAISGIFVDGSFIPKGSGYHVNYEYGQVVFDTPISTTSTVQLEYSHKWIDVVNADSSPWFRKSQTRSFRLDDPMFTANSGTWGDLAENRLQLPVVAVESVGKNYEGYQLGGHQYARNRVVLHVIAEDPRTAKKIASVLAEQSESTIFMYDPGRMAQHNRFPLDYRGEIASGALCYPDLIKATGDGGYRYTNKAQNGKLRIFESTEQDCDRLHENIYHCPVRWNTEVILHQI